MKYNNGTLNHIHFKNCQTDYFHHEKIISVKLSLEKLFWFNDPPIGSKY
jgi:hypothetical protein